MKTTQHPQWGLNQGPLDLESVALPIGLDNGFCKILRKELKFKQTKQTLFCCILNPNIVDQC